MINLNEYIIEKLRINKTIKISNACGLTKKEMESLKGIITVFQKTKHPEEETFNVFHQMMGNKFGPNDDRTNREIIIDIFNEYADGLPEIIGGNDDLETDKEIFGMIRKTDDFEWVDEK